VNRAQLEHLIRAAAEVTNEYEFVVVGSQSILGAIPNPPPELTMSMEADMYPMRAEEKADRIDGALGEGSPFHDTYGYYAQGRLRDGVLAGRLERQAAADPEPRNQRARRVLPGRARPLHGKSPRRAGRRIGSSTSR